MNKAEVFGAILIIIGILIIGVPILIGSFVLHPILGCVVLGILLLIIGGFLISKCDDF